VWCASRGRWTRLRAIVFFFASRGSKGGYPLAALGSEDSSSPFFYPLRAKMVMRRCAGSERVRAALGSDGEFALR